MSETCDHVIVLAGGICDVRCARPAGHKGGHRVQWNEDDELWEVMRPYAEAKGIGREAFFIGTRMLQSLRTPEEAEALARFIRGSR